MGKLFGTDGVRGIANEFLSCELAFKLGQCGALALTSEVHRPRIIIGRDTRVSGKMLLCALVSGICSVGAEVIDVGVIPTPGVAFLTGAYEADAGVVISASHNSFEYNGIKWFDGRGFKLPDSVEEQIELMVLEGTPTLAKGASIGTMTYSGKSREEYIDYLASRVPCDLSGLKIVLDCANGAASQYAPELFSQMGAEVFPFYNMPDGTNINLKCGSTHPSKLQRRVVELGADLGLAFDGDADRLIAADEFGVPVDGDRIMAICAMWLKEQGKLKKNTLVATVMSNLGMKVTLKEQGINVVETAVGDRYVLERMIDGGYNLGGEQSGHVIFLDDNTTGDGMMSGLRLCEVLKGKKERLSHLSRQVKIYPQVLVNLELDNDKKCLYAQDEQIMALIAEMERTLDGNGRVLVRPSGTEPKVRIMLEGEKEEEIDRMAVALAKAIAEKFGGKIT